MALLPDWALYSWCGVQTALCMGWSAALSHFALRYLRMRRHPQVAARYPKLVLWTTLCWLVLIALQFPLRALILVWALTGDGPEAGFQRETASGSVWLFLANQVTFAVAFYPGLTLLVLRFYLMRFDVKHAVACNQEQWIAHLDNRAQQGKARNWFIANKGSWGNAWRLQRVAWAFAAALTLADLLTTTVIPAVLCGILTSTALAILLWKTPNLDDRVFLRHELSLVLHWMLAILVAWLSQVAFMLAFRWLPGLLLFYTLRSFCCFMAFFVQTQWVLARVQELEALAKAQLSPHSMGSGAPEVVVGVGRGRANTGEGNEEATTPRRRELTLPTFTRSRSRSRSRSPSRTPNGRVTVRDCLGDSQLFKALISHLLKEFGEESLLCIVELSQLQRMHDIDCTVQLPADIMDIHCSALQVDGLHRRCAALCEKYLLTSAALCCNLSFENRARATRIHERCHAVGNEKDVDAEEVCTLVRLVIKELLSLLEDPLGRFVRTAEFKSITWGDHMPY